MSHSGTFPLKTKHLKLLKSGSPFRISPSHRWTTSLVGECLDKPHAQCRLLHAKGPRDADLIATNGTLAPEGGYARTVSNPAPKTSQPEKEA